MLCILTSMVCGATSHISYGHLGLAWLAGSFEYGLLLGGAQWRDNKDKCVIGIFVLV